MATPAVTLDSGARVAVYGRGRPVLLAPGAGAGTDHPFMVGLRERLDDAGLTVATIDYPYRVEGRSRPDRFERLVTAHLEAFGWVAEKAGTAPVMVGKSMGGRIGSHLEVAAPGLVFLGYPLVAAGHTDPRPTSHLVGRGPMLFIQGERDALAPQPLISAVVRGLPQATMEVIPGADHSFRTPRALGVEPAAMLDRLAGLAIRWITALPAVRSR